jgi:hypothetical protein
MPSLQEIWDKIRHRKAVVPASCAIDPKRVLTPLRWTSAIVPQKHYFGIVVDELYLADSRQWYSEYDPLVLAITDFRRAGKAVTLPFVVGPELLSKLAKKAPQEMLYRDTRVAGAHPFRGGTVISTICLCQVRRKDYARQLLRVVESVSGAVPFASDLSTYTKFASSLLDGVDTLFEVGETIPLVGVRQEFDYDLGSPIHPGYFALIDGPEGEVSPEKLWVKDSSLLYGSQEGDLKPFREASYVLFSIRGAQEITDLESIPQHKTAQSIISLSASIEPADWKRAKAELLVLLRELLTSPDLTRDQALSYHEDIVKQAREAHERASKIATLSAEPQSATRDALRGAVAILDLPD